MVSSDEINSFVKAAYDCNFHLMQQFIDVGIDIDAVGSFGTALYVAINNGDSADVVNYLLSQGANPNVPFNGIYPIHLSIDIERDIVNNTGRYPEPIAFITYVLLLAGADVNAVDDNGRTPLSWARMAGHKQAAALLEARGAVAENL
ncbi:MAG: ankyrin repeat domain-containing protein [Lyngbya sp. HA4199-MV5]|jgi:ankyrin repeat protein|nr:ankyrin repeat domain-containing protein [Lyngbya sp. HA4199-MV5]